jgi:quinol monooxygenase YgiN
MEEEIVLIVKVIAKKGSEDNVKNELLSLVEPTRKEKGCRQYTLHVEPDTKILVFYGVWANNDLLQLHTHTDHFKKVMAKIKELLSEPMNVMVLNKI